jgi:hypothetical protein
MNLLSLYLFENKYISHSSRFHTEFCGCRSLPLEMLVRVMVDRYGISGHEYVPLVVSTSRSFLHSWLITGFVTRLTRRVPLVEHELLTLPEHLSSPTVFSGVRVTRSLTLCVCFVDRCLSFCVVFLWSLCCLFFFDIRILITTLVFSSSSYTVTYILRVVVLYAVRYAG